MPPVCSPSSATTRREPLDNDIRGDSQWAAAMADTSPNGALKWFDDPSNFGDDSPWLQVWCNDPSGCGPGAEHGDIIFRTLKADAQSDSRHRTAGRPANDRIVSIPTAGDDLPVLTTPATINVTDPHATDVSSRSARAST